MAVIRGLSILIILVVLLQVHAAVVENASGRIINGNTATANFEYHAHLLMDTAGPNAITVVGSGVVIARRLILTTAQNIFGLNNFRAGVGNIVRDSVIWRNAVIGTHVSDFNPITLENNIGYLIFSDGAFDNLNVTPIPLPDESFGNNLPLENEQGRFTGFGHTVNGADFALYLQYGFNRVTDDLTCATTYPNLSMDQVFCGLDTVTHNKICGGDQGGAFVTRVNGVEYLTGISSSVLGGNCIRDQPALFVRLVHYRTAISVMINLFN